jgi:hypothetical protein
VSDVALGWSGGSCPIDASARSVTRDRSERFPRHQRQSVRRCGHPGGEPRGELDLDGLVAIPRRLSYRVEYRCAERPAPVIA